MPKNDWLSQQQAKIDVLLSKTRCFTIQQMMDYSVLAFSSWYEENVKDEIETEVAKSFIEHLHEAMMEYSKIVIDDDKPQRKGGNGDKQLNYSKGKLDQALMRIIPDYPDWEERYGKCL